MESEIPSNYEQMKQQRVDLEQQLSELADIFDGLDNPAVAEKVAQLEVQKAERTGQLNKLSAEIENSKTEISNISEKISKCSFGATQKLFEAINCQRLFFIKNKSKIIFDSHTGYLFPNPEYFDDIPKLFGHYTGVSTFKDTVSGYNELVIENYVGWHLPEINQLFIYIQPFTEILDKHCPVTLLQTGNFKDISREHRRSIVASCSYQDSQYLKKIFEEKNLHNHVLGSEQWTENRAGYYNSNAVSYPFFDKLASQDFSPDNNVFSPQERAQKVLKLFIQEGWIPKFDDEEITKLYEKMYITRPALIKQLAEINEKLAELPPPKTGFADGIDFAELIKGYDLESIRNSLVRYHAELVRWFSELLANLDDFSREQAPLLAEAQTLIDSLRDTIDEDDGQDAGEKMLTERARYLSQHLDFGLESLQAELVAFKNEVMISRDTLTSARTLTDLRQIEKQERPDFYLVAEHSTELIKQRLHGVDWFREHKELATALIELHQEWRSDLHTFEHTTCTHFMEKCAGESIDSEQGEAWFTEWRRERLLAEEHLLPLMRAGIERVIPVEIVVEVVKLLKSSIRDQLGNFFYDKRIALHQKFAFEPSGELQERFEKESALASINSEFQKQLEELIFKIDGTEGRLFLVRWAKDWYDSLVGDVLAFIDKDEFHERIARETLDGFRAMKRHTLEAFLQDVKAYAVAREEKDKEWNSLLFRMRSDLAKKADKVKKSTK